MTAILEAAGSRGVEVGERRISRQRLAAEHVWDIVTKGHTILPDGSILRPKARDYLETLRWLYGHIDGPPKSEAEVTHSGGIRVHVTYDDPDDSDPSAEAAPGTADGDS